MSGPGPGAVSPALRRRPLGRTGFQAAAVGAGDVADPKLGTARCVEVLERAVALGVNLLDTAPAYEDGLGETIVGHVVRNHRRDELFVIDKVDRLRSPAIPQLDSSIFRLRLEIIDLAVFHGVSSVAELERLLAPGGGFDQLDVARREGLIRFRGVSCHHPDVVERCLAEGRSDVLLFPVGPYVHPRYRELIARSREKGVGVVGFKAFGAGKLLGPTSGYGKSLPPDAPEEARRVRTRLDVGRCVRYTLTLDPDVALLGMSTIPEVEEALGQAAAFAPMGAEEMAAVERDAAAEVRGKGKVWWDPGEPTP
jgi:aryl-alcohol dehydrogenase-like predicted oxidoreductase